MTMMVAVALWCFHGVALLWNWGRYRPGIALLHGVGTAVLAGALAWLGAPAWAMYGAGALLGAVAGWGHPLAPGLWVGVGLLWPLPFLLSSAPALLAVVAFALAAQIAAAVVSFVKGSL